MPAEGACLRLYPAGHIVEIAADGVGVHIVYLAAGRSGGTVDDARERIETDEAVEPPYAFGDVDVENIAAESVANVNGIFKGSDALGDQHHFEHLRRASRVGYGRKGIRLFDEGEFRYFKMPGSEGVGSGDEY